MNNENSGMNTHVRFKKKPKLILEIQARNKHDKYKAKITGILFANNAEIIRKAKLIIFILGSKDCKKPSFTEYSRANRESLKNDRIPLFFIYLLLRVLL